MDNYIQFVAIFIIYFANIVIGILYNVICMKNEGMYQADII